MKDVVLDPMPNCQVCSFAEEGPHPAEYDSPYKQLHGSWAYMCAPQFKKHGNPVVAFHLIPEQKEST